METLRKILAYFLPIVEAFATIVTVAGALNYSNASGLYIVCALVVFCFAAYHIVKGVKATIKSKSEGGLE